MYIYIYILYIIIVIIIIIIIIIIFNIIFNIHTYIITYIYIYNYTSPATIRGVARGGKIHAPGLRTPQPAAAPGRGRRQGGGAAASRVHGAVDVGEMMGKMGRKIGDLWVEPLDISTINMG